MILWTDNEDFVRLTLTKQGKSYEKIADEMNTLFATEKFTKDAVRGRARRTNTTFDDLAQCNDTFDQKWEKFCNLLGQKKTLLKAQSEPNVKAESFAVFSDIHVPTHNVDALIDAVESASKLTDVCVIAGDFMDTASFSPHFIDKQPNVEDEIREGKLVANYLDSKFERVYYLRGNHEMWYNKAKAKIPTEFRFLLKDNFQEYVVADLEHSIVTNNFFIQIGDCIVGHPSMFTNKRMQDVIASFKYFDNWSQRYGLDEIRCYVHAHIHKLGTLFIEHGGRKVKLFEAGCLCAISENLTSGRTVSFDPPSEGWVYITQNNGRTVFNESREFVYEGNTASFETVGYNNGGIIEILEESL